MSSKVPSHAHRWYPVSYDSDGDPAVWACGMYRGCIKTLNTRSEYEQELRKAQKKGWQTIDMEAPDR